MACYLSRASDMPTGDKIKIKMSRRMVFSGEKNWYFTRTYRWSYRSLSMSTRSWIEVVITLAPVKDVMFWMKIPRLNIDSRVRKRHVFHFIVQFCLLKRRWKSTPRTERMVCNFCTKWTCKSFDVARLMADITTGGVTLRIKKLNRHTHTHYGHSFVGPCTDWKGLNQDRCKGKTHSPDQKDETAYWPMKSETPYPPSV